MANKVLCSCGTLLSIDLHQGHGLGLLLNEEVAAMPTDADTPCGALLDLIVRESSVVVTCPKCGSLSVVDSQLNIKRYSPA